MIRRAPSDPPATATTKPSAGKPSAARAGRAALRRPVDGQDLGADRVAGDDRPRQRRARKRHRAGRGKPASQAVGEAGHGVLLGDHQRDPPDDRRDRAGHAGVAADGDHHGGADAAHQDHGLDHGDRQAGDGARRCRG